MNIDTPTDWRKGQTLFNFLEWLRTVKKMPRNQNERMADPFFLEDEELDELFREFLEFRKAF